MKILNKVNALVEELGRQFLSVTNLDGDPNIAISIDKNNPVKTVHNIVLKFYTGFSINFLALDKLYNWSINGLKIALTSVSLPTRYIDTSYNWFCNYSLFILEVIALKKILPNLPMLADQAKNAVGGGIAGEVIYHFIKHLPGGIVGSTIQGYDDCEVQKELNKKFPKIAAIAGFFNGIGCCILLNFINGIANAMADMAPEEYQDQARAMGHVLGFLILVSIKQNTMCFVEGKVLNFFQERFYEDNQTATKESDGKNPGFAEKITQEREEPEQKKTSCCCR